MRPATENSREYIQFCFDLYRDALRRSVTGDDIEQEWVQLTRRMWLQAANPYRRRCGRISRFRSNA